MREESRTGFDSPEEESSTGTVRFSVADMQPQDVPEVAALEKKIFSMPWSENGFLSALRQPDALYLTVREPEFSALSSGGRLIGYCGLLQSFEEADIVNVAVCEDCRGKGIGFAMLSELMRRGRLRGIERFTLEVRKSNAAALHLYEKLGFSSAGIRRNFYEKPREDAVIMWNPCYCSPDDAT